MIFQHTWQQVLDGTKTQTRRLRAQPPYVGRTYAVQPGRGKPAVGRIRITAIRQQRVQDITAEDALAEGLVCPDCNNGWITVYSATDMFGCSEVECGHAGLIDEYAQLWDTIHTKPGTRWADNPLVWVLEFERVGEGETACSKCGGAGTIGPGICSRCGGAGVGCVSDEN
ncbi:MAG: ASCH domain-containing protein [bacterium]